MTDTDGANEHRPVRYNKYNNQIKLYYNMNHSEKLSERRIFQIKRRFEQKKETKALSVSIAKITLKKRKGKAAVDQYRIYYRSQRLIEIFD